MLLFMVKYSNAVNKRIFTILKDLPAEELTKRRDTRFKNIYGVINHIVFTDLLLFKLLRSIDPDLILISTNDYDHLRTGYNQIVVENVKEANELCDSIENSIYAIVDDLTEEQLKMDVPSLGLSLYEIMTHVFIHRAHHRGELKSIFDSLGIQDDIAGTLHSLHSVK